MDVKDDGGPAFPSPVGGSSFTGPDGYTTWQFPGAQGMSLRDWFAGQAIPVVAAQQIENLTKCVAVAYAGKLPPEDEMKELGKLAATQTAENCYRIADAMIAARKET